MLKAKKMIEWQRLVAPSVVAAKRDKITEQLNLNNKDYHSRLERGTESSAKRKSVTLEGLEEQQAKALAQHFAGQVEQAGRDVVQAEAK